jgi:hypothetical protein
MPTLKIEGVPQLDGEYELDISRFTNWELHLIKQETQTDGRPGVRANEIEEAFAAGDNDLLVAIALIILQRAGRGELRQNKNLLWGADAGSITFDLTEDEKAEVDAVPPESEPGSSESNASENGRSGESSEADSGKLATLPSRTGSPHSETVRSVAD